MGEVGQKSLYTWGGGQTFLHTQGGQTFSVGGRSGNDDVYSGKEEGVSKANILASKASKWP